MAKRGEVLAIGFGTTVAMWTVGYLCRMPPAPLPSKWVFQLMLACMLCGGFVAGRYSPRGWRCGAEAGLLSAVLNLLILGGIVTSGETTPLLPSALFWVPGSLLLGCVIGAAGAAVGSQVPFTHSRGTNWTAAFAHVAALATMVLIIVGGLVTSNEAGLAVVDWPNSFGRNMFLYPISRMTGGIYYEHAHRLFGSLVGLTTLALAWHLQRADRRKWVKRLGWGALLLVIVQGILGGLRVTGHFTLSTARADMKPSIALAVVHGVLGQVFFAVIVAIGTITTRAWEELAEGERTARADTDRSLNLALLLLAVGQLVLGALLRHVTRGLLIHITLGTIVVSLAAACGARAWALYDGWPRVSVTGRTLLFVSALQLLLGIGALVAVGSRSDPLSPAPLEVALATTHQVVGAALLAVVTILLLWMAQLRPPRSPRGGTT